MLAWLTVLTLLKGSEGTPRCCGNTPPGAELRVQLQPLPPTPCIATVKSLPLGPSHPAVKRGQWGCLAFGASSPLMAARSSDPTAVQGQRWAQLGTCKHLVSTGDASGKAKGAGIWQATRQEQALQRLLLDQPRVLSVTCLGLKRSHGQAPLDRWDTVILHHNGVNPKQHGPVWASLNPLPAKSLGQTCPRTLA